MQDALPFFVGSGRSGTTLVQAIFSSHPDLAVCHESQFIPHLARRRYLRDGVFATEDFLDDLGRNANFRRLELPPLLVRNALSTPPVSSYADAVRRLLGVYAAQEGKPRYGDKTPGYVLHMEELARLFPEARFVHVIRDGRDVALGYLDQPWGPRSIAEGALYWKGRVEKGRAAGESLGPNRYYELKYEDLIARPEETVRALCPFVGVAFNEGMLRYFERSERFRSQSAHPEAHAHLSRPPTSGLRDWRRQLSPHDLVVFELLAGRLLTRLGYERSDGHPGPHSIGSAATAWIQWQAKRASTLRKRVKARLRRQPQPRRANSDYP